MSAPRWLTFRQASETVGRNIRTLHRWQRDGMPTSLDDRGRRIVREDILRAEHRKRLKSWPAHQYRMRRNSMP